MCVKLSDDLACMVLVVNVVELDVSELNVHCPSALSLSCYADRQTTFIVM